MLIVPVEKGLDWSRAPIVTGIFILLNCLIYLAWQTGDESKLENAAAFYQQSTLAEVEYPIFISHLHQYQKHHLANELEEAWKAGDKESVYYHIILDRSFTHFVHKTDANFWGDDIFSAWKQDRKTLEEKIQTLSFIRLGLISGESKAITYLTHQFLHGDIWHLLGNMIFLAIIGMGVEAAIGSALFFVGYLLCGVLAGAFYGLITPSPFIPLVGASGAISALMGMYAVIYGLRKIKFFYFFFFYFGYVTAPALAVLPVWILLEVVQAIFNTDSFVAYWAHVGGLVSGSALMFALQKWVLTVDEKFYEPVTDEGDEYRQDLNRLMQQVGQFSFSTAQKTLTELLEKYPDDMNLMTQQYHLAKLQGNQQSIQPLLEELLDKATHAPHNEIKAETLLIDFQTQYTDAQISIDTRLRLLIYLITPKTLDTAEKILRSLLNEKVDDPRLLKAVRTFIRHYQDTNDTKTLYRYQQLAESLEAIE